MNILKKNQILIFFLIQVLIALNFFGPIEIVFLKQRQLQMSNIFSLFSIFSVFIIILEIPSGFCSDKLGRKKTILLSVLFGVLGNIILLFSKNYYSYIIAYICFAINISFMSGSDIAFLYDTLMDFGKEDEFDIYLSKLMSITFYVQAISALFSGIIIKINLETTLLAEIFTCILALFLSFLLVEPKKIYVDVSKDNNIIINKNNLFNANFKKIIGIILAMSIFSTSTLIGVKLSQPLLSEAGISISWFGLFSAISMFLSGLCSQYSSKFTKKFNINTMIIILFSIPILIFILIFIFGVKLYVFALLLLIPMSKALSNIVTTTFINNSISSKYRATLNSIISFSFRCIYILVIPLIGYLIDSLGLRVICGILSILFILIYSLLYLFKLLYKKSKYYYN
jgi:MFS family permease